MTEQNFERRLELSIEFAKLKNRCDDVCTAYEKEIADRNQLLVNVAIDIHLYASTELRLQPAIRELERLVRELRPKPRLGFPNRPRNREKTRDRLEDLSPLTSREEHVECFGCSSPTYCAEHGCNIKRQQEADRQFGQPHHGHDER